MGLNAQSFSGLPPPSVGHLSPSDRFLLLFRASDPSLSPPFSLFPGVLTLPLPLTGSSPFHWAHFDASSDSIGTPPSVGLGGTSFFLIACSSLFDVLTLHPQNSHPLRRTSSSLSTLPNVTPPSAPLVREGSFSRFCLTSDPLRGVASLFVVRADFFFGPMRDGGGFFQGSLGSRNADFPLFLLFFSHLSCPQQAK